MIDVGADSSGTPNGPLPTEDARELAGVPDGFGRFWTPYRMAYIHGEGKPADASDRTCPFCSAPGKADDEGLIVHRGATCFVLMNLFPYNSGHLLVCPYRHVSDYTELTDAERVELGELTATAMRVFGIEKAEDVTPNDRRNAKAVNFGVVYGISDFGLANNLGISRKAAKDYIQTYFERFPGIKNYMETIVREARDKGYVETIYHRRRSLPDINSRNFNIRNFAERTAINSPIQGSAADILKVAMINLDRALTEKNFKSRMLLQVHDEIVLEVPNDELTAVRQLVKETMEAAIELAVPLVADENAGQTWYEAK